jgi:micrococcal nuclease
MDSGTTNFMRDRGPWCLRVWLPIALLISLPCVGCLGLDGPLVAETDDDGDGDSESESETGPAPSGCGPSTGVVDHVVDGDTIELDDGTRVRYLLIDTPEITNGKNDCFGAEAREYNHTLVTGRTITLAYDEECQDRFGRLLAYVSEGELDVNRTLLEEGYACILHISPNGDDLVSEYQALEDMAKADGVGMWSACGTVACE